MTLSIVARDRTTGSLGVAVTTCMPAVGAIVPWARAGVGAVATQAIVERAYGPRCLDALAAGATAAEALLAAQAEDPLAMLRQVGVVGVDGSAAAATGELCIDHAGEVVGDGFAAQGNMMGSPLVWPAIADAFVGTAGPLARRMLTALEAGQAAGGDARGRLSAALIVVEGEPPATPGGGTIVDLRVDAADDPLGELARLLATADAFALLERAIEQITAGDAASALATVDEALALQPGEGNMRFLRGGALAATGQTEAGIAELRALVRDHPPWGIVIRSFVAKGLIALPEGLDIDTVLGATPPA